MVILGDSHQAIRYARAGRGLTMSEKLPFRLRDFYNDSEDPELRQAAFQQ